MTDPEIQILDAIQVVQAGVRWRPGSAARHLQKRKQRGHLPVDATLEDYERIIQAIVHGQDTQVYLYWHNDTPYVTLVSVVGNRYWLVMFDLEGVIESAFVVERPDHYLSKPAFAYRGTLGEVRT